MINKIKNHIRINKRAYILGSILAVSLIARVWYSLRGSVIWWDEAIYVGMGKYIATNGAIGLWEFFRPPVLPLVYSFLYLLHIPLIFAGKIMVLFASIGSIYLVYKIGEKIEKNAGIIGSILLSLTPVFFTFSNIALTDIPSAFFALLALYSFTRSKYLQAGIFSGVAFLLRFPQGLILVCLCLSLIAEAKDKNYKIWIKNVFQRGLAIGLGFSILVVPYLISNYFLYGDIFKPIKSASAVIGGYSYLYDLGTWYYAIQIWTSAPLLYFAILSPLLFFRNSNKISISNKSLLATLVSATFFILYFFWQSHKELRYSIAFIPYLSILAGCGLAFCINNFKYKKILMLLFGVATLFFVYKLYPYVKFKENDPYSQFYLYIKDIKGSYLSTTPVPTAVGDVKLTYFFQSYKTFDDVYQREHDTIDGVIINSCDIFCDAKATGGSCQSDVEKIYKEIKPPFEKTYKEKVNECIFTVYEK